MGRHQVVAGARDVGPGLRRRPWNHGLLIRFARAGCRAGRAISNTEVDHPVCCHLFLRLGRRRVFGGTFAIFLVSHLLPKQFSIALRYARTMWLLRLPEMLNSFLYRFGLRTHAVSWYSIRHTASPSGAVHTKICGQPRALPMRQNPTSVPEIFFLHAAAWKVHTRRLFNGLSLPLLVGITRD